MIVISHFQAIAIISLITQTDERIPAHLLLAPSLTHSLTNLLAPFGGSNRGN